MLHSEDATNFVKRATMKYIVYTAMCHSNCNRFIIAVHCEGLSGLVTGLCGSWCVNLVSTE